MEKDLREQYHVFLKLEREIPLRPFSVELIISVDLGKGVPPRELNPHELNKT